jgi:signal transduction histidine kinase/ligand-binding sensor domain-containing protein
MCIRRFLVFLFLICAFISRATNLRFTNLGMQQGLSATSAGCIFTDSRGFTWIATNTGLNRFDGESFTVFSPHRHDSASLPGEIINSIGEDSSGMLWIGTNLGIARFNPWNGKAETIKQFHSEGGDMDLCISAMVDHDQNVWARSVDGLWKYDRTKNYFIKQLRCDGKNNRPDRCTNFYEDRHHRFWITSYSGIYQYDPSSGSLDNFLPGGKPALVTSIFEDHSGKLWYSTWGGGVGFFNPKTKIFFARKWVENPVIPSAENIAMGFAEVLNENQYQLWIATNAGLVLVKNPQDENYELIFFHHDPSNPESISSDQVNYVWESNHQLWAGTGGGVSVLLPEKQAFRDFAPDYKGQTIHLVNEKNGNLFSCTWYGNGLQKIDPHGNILRCWKTIPENSNDIDCGQVSDVVRGKDGSLWVATFGGLSHGDADGNSFQQVLPVAGENSICDKHITCLAVDREGKLWCGSYGKGISVLDPATNIFKNFTRQSSGLTDNLVWTMVCNSEGNTWVGTNKGICYFDKDKNKFISTEYILRDADTVLLTICSNIFEDKEGRMWFGTDNGLFVREKNNSFHVYQKEEGLADNRIRGIREDHSGNIWVSTSNGLSELDPFTGKFTNFSLGSGLPVTNLEGDLNMLDDGTLLLGLSDRMLAFRPGQMKPNPSLSVFINSITVSGKNYSFDKDPSGLQQVEFSWNDNAISFDFIAPGLRGNPSVRYEFQLEGADENWVNADSHHSANYAGLSPGNYIFRCRASVNNGAWSSPASFSFVIYPPLWKRWWFILSAIIIALTLVILIVRRESTRKIREKLLILEKRQAVEIERNRISRDMHDDLGSGLTKIAILSEVVKKKIRQKDDSQKQVDIISESARELVDNLNEIIWALNPGNDNLRNLAAYIREYADRYLEPFEINCKCIVPENLPDLHLSEEKRRNIFLVVKEALHNIVKHSGAKNVELVFTQDKNFSVEIKDDGKGFTEAREFGNGLKSMKKRAEAIGAEFFMESIPGKGTSIRIFFQVPE